MSVKERVRLGIGKYSFLQINERSRFSGDFIKTIRGITFSNY